MALPGRGSCSATISCLAVSFPPFPRAPLTSSGRTQSASPGPASTTPRRSASVAPMAATGTNSINSNMVLIFILLIISIIIVTRLIPRDSTTARLPRSVEFSGGSKELPSPLGSSLDALPIPPTKYYPRNKIGNLVLGENSTGGSENKSTASMSNRIVLNQTGFLTNALLSNNSHEGGACFSCSLLLLLNGEKTREGGEGSSSSYIATTGPVVVLFATLCKMVE